MHGDSRLYTYGGSRECHVEPTSIVPINQGEGEKGEEKKKNENPFVNQCGTQHPPGSVYYAYAAYAWGSQALAKRVPYASSIKSRHLKHR